MFFESRAHEERWSNMISCASDQDWLHGAVYYLIALTQLPLSVCYDEANDSIRHDALSFETLSKSERCAIALAYDILNKDNSTYVFDILDYEEEWLVYYVEALRHCHSYWCLKYAMVYLYDPSEEHPTERYRFPEPLQAMLFAKLLSVIYKNEGHKLLIMYDDNDYTDLVVSNQKHSVNSQITIGDENIEKTKLKTEFFVRYVSLGMPVKYRLPQNMFDKKE